MQRQKTISNKTLGVILGISVAVLWPSASLDAGLVPSFQGLGDLPDGLFDSVANGISADGAVVVGFSGSASGFEAFRWTSDGGMVGLGDLPGGPAQSFNFARSASADGAVVVGRGRSESGAEAFRWTSDGGMVGLGDLPGGSFRSSANGVSADGSVVVGHSNSASGSPQAFRWTAGGGMVGLGDLPGGTLFLSQASATSADGSVVVGASISASGEEAFRWTADGGMVGLGDLPGGIFKSAASAVSADGAVIVGQGWSASGREAFRWTVYGMVGLGDLPGGPFQSVAFGTSADGAVVVGQSATSFTSSSREAFLWTADDGMRLLQDLLANDFGLNLTGWVLESATSISADGMSIVGFGTNPDGFREAWVATIPELATPEELLSQLIQNIIDLGLRQGIEKSLVAKLDAVLQALGDMSENNDVAACSALQAFINAVEAQSGHQIPEADADALIAAAQAIRELLGCPQ